MKAKVAALEEFARHREMVIAMTISKHETEYELLAAQCDALLLQSDRECVRIGYEMFNALEAHFVFHASAWAASDGTYCIAPSDTIKTHSATITNINAPLQEVTHPYTSCEQRH